MFVTRKCLLIWHEKDLTYRQMTPGLIDRFNRLLLKWPDSTNAKQGSLVLTHTEHISHRNNKTFHYTQGLSIKINSLATDAREQTNKQKNAETDFSHGPKQYIFVGNI